MSQYQDLIVCKICNKLFDEPIYLPCKHTVCKIHLKEENLIKKNKIECKICKLECDVSNKSDFKENLHVRAMLEADVYLSNDEKKVKKKLHALINKIQKVYVETQNKQLAFELESFEYFKEIRRQIDLQREELKEKIDEFAFSMIDLTKKTEKIYKDKLEFLQKSLKPFKSEEAMIEIKEIIRDPSFNKEDLKELETKNENFIRNFNEMKNELKLIQCKMNLCSFKAKETSSKIIGDLRLNGLNKNLVTASSNHTVNIWNLESFECIQTLSGHTGKVYFAEILPENKLITGSQDNMLRIYDLEKNLLLKTIDNGGAVMCLKALSEPNLIATGTFNDIKILNIATEEEKKFIAHDNAWIRDLTQNLIGEIISCAQDSFIKIWDFAKFSETELLPIAKKVLKGHTGPIFCLKIINKCILASGSEDTIIKLWDMGLGVCVISLSGHTSWVKGLDLTNDGRLISCSLDKTIKIWNLETGDVVTTLHGHSEKVLSIKYYQNDKIISGDYRGDIKIWDLKSGLCIKTMNENLNSKENQIFNLNIF